MEVKVEVQVADEQVTEVGVHKSTPAKLSLDVPGALRWCGCWLCDPSRALIGQLRRELTAETERDNRGQGSWQQNFQSTRETTISHSRRDENSSI